MFTPIFEPIFKPLFRPMYSGGGNIPFVDKARWDFLDVPGGYEMHGKATPLSFSRASNGSRINSASSLAIEGPNVLRIDHDPLTGEELGGLFEGQKASLGPLYSEPESGQITIAGDSVNFDPNPDRGFDRWVHIDRSEVTSYVVVGTFNSGVVLGTTYVLSAYIMMDDGGPVTIGNATNVNADLSIVMAGTASDTNTFVQDLGGGLYRIYRTRLADVETLNTFQFRKYPAQTDRGFRITGFQVELGGLSSYVRNNGSLLVRQADTCTIPDLAAAGFDPEGGMILCKVRAYPGSAQGAASRVLFVQSGADNIEIRLRSNAGFSNYPTAMLGNVSQSAGATATASDVWEYLALSYSASGNGYFARKRGDNPPVVSGLFGSWSGVTPPQLILGQNLNGHLRTLELHAGQFSAADLEAALNAFASS